MYKEEIQNSNHLQTDVIAYQIRDNCYLNLTNRCTLRCRFCPKFNHLWDVKSYSLRLKKEPSVSQVLQSIGDVSQYKEIVFCGLGEPTIRLDTLLSVARKLKEKPCFIRLNTDGLANYLYQRDITAELAEVIDAVSVSLNAQNETLYAEHCRPPEKYLRNEVVKFIRSCRKNINNVTLTAIEGLPGVNTSECLLQAKKLDVSFKKRTLDQVG